MHHLLVSEGVTPTISILDTLSLSMVNYFNPVHFTCLAPRPMAFLHKSCYQEQGPESKRI